MFTKGSTLFLCLLGSKTTFAVMNYLSVENISKNYAEKILFEKISFGLDKGQKIALVAKNGSGKSTLLNCLTGKDVPDEGSIVYRKEITVGFLEQEQKFDNSKTVIETIYDTNSDKIKFSKEYEELLSQPEKADRMQEVFEKLSELDAWGVQSSIDEILSKLKLHDHNQTVGNMSGGQKRRLAMAKIFIEDPDIIILDEPTNHLDLDMIEWLEKFLAAKNITLFMVTHDRYFLERVCNEILELDGGDLHSYKGNYSYYLDKRAERYANAQANIEKAKNLFRKELEWMRRQPKARGTKSKARISDFYETEKIAKTNIKEDQVEIEVSMERLGNKILEMHKVSKAYGDKIILDKFDYIFKRKERVGLVGANGSGKSTFLNIITEKEPADSGKVVIGETIRYGYYTQTGLVLKEDKRVIDVIKDIGEYLPMSNGKKLSATGLLERFLFDNRMHYQFVSTLSGGERKRLYLITILMQNPNFLIMDEPTNDLDIFTIQILEDYLLSFGGCLIIVSHDRYFMDKIADHLFVMNGDGTVNDILGNYTKYREFKREKKSLGKKVQTQNEKPAVKVEKEKTKLTHKERIEFNNLEKEIANLEARKNELSEELNKGDLPYSEIEKISNELTETVNAIDTKSERWMELADFAD